MRNLIVGVIIGVVCVSSIAAVSPVVIGPLATQASPPDGYTENLTDQERASLNAWMLEFRTASGALARCLDNDIEPINTEYNGVVSTILAKLDNADVLPNSSNLDGAEPMTKAQVVTVVSYMQGALSYNTDAHRQSLAKACGESNID